MLVPDLSLLVADKRHPSLAGSYLAAATTYAALFGKDPVPATYTAGLPPDLARTLREAARDAVNAYKAR